MAGVTTYTCIKCRPIDTKIIEAYEILTNTSKAVSQQEADRVAAENARVSAENERTRVFNQDHGTAVLDHGIAVEDHGTAGSDHITAVSDHNTAAEDHTLAVSDHQTAGEDHSAVTTATSRANDAAAAAEHMVDIHQGPPGPTPDISIGTVTTGNPGTSASASMTGTPEEPVLNMTIPRGDVGPAPDMSIGTVTTGAAGSPASATITGTPEAPVLNLTIPQGIQGNTGSSVDYPYELVNNRTTDDATKGLSAAEGKRLGDDLTELEHEADELDVEINGYVEPDIYLDLGTIESGYWAGNVGDTISGAGGGYRYPAFSLESYVGKKIELKLNNASTGSRDTAICDSAGKILYRWSETQMMTETPILTIESGWYLYVSYHYTTTTYSMRIIGTVTRGIVDDIEDLQDYHTRIPDIKVVPIGITFSNNSMALDNSATYPACGFTRSLSKRIYSNGGYGRINISIPDTDFDSGSFGLLIPWEMQEKIRLFFYYGNAADYTCYTRYAEESATLGKIYYLQGKTFTRVNFPKTDKVQIRVELNADLVDQNWEIYITDNAILNDHLPVAPICVMYDGGGWSGSVIDNGETISLWELHHRYNIPYGIGLYPGQGVENAEVAQDLASGFAEVIYRCADIEDVISGTDAQIVSVLNDGWNALDVFSKMLVLPKHKLDTKTMRCYTKAGADIVRTQCNGLDGTLSSKYGDAELFTLPSTRLGMDGSGTDEILKFPNLLWEHGVGIPPAGYVGNDYVDTTGENTPLLFQKLYGLMQSGDLVCLRPSEWVAYCKSH